jgi:hypothetical protein
MREQRPKIGVHLIEGRQQPLAPLAVQRGDPGAQLGHRGLQIGALGTSSVVLGLQLARVLLGAQVDRAQRVARAAQPGDLGSSASARAWLPGPR